VAAGYTPLQSQGIGLDMVASGAGKRRLQDRRSYTIRVEVDNSIG
jgi:hypothetical protein